MLRTLRNVQPQEALMALSAAITELMPDPGVDFRVIDSPLTIRVLDEAFDRTKVNPLDHSTEEQARVLDLLGDEISERVLTPQTKEQSRIRLGEQGYLRPDQYEIEFSEHFKRTAIKRGIRPAHVEDAVRHSDILEHFMPERMQDEGAPSYSMYVKSVSIPNGDFLLFVITRRVGYTLVILAAYQIYPGDVDIKNAVKAIDILKAFTEKYGIYLESPYLPRTKFIMYEAFLMPTDGPDFSLAFGPTNDGNWESMFSIKPNPLHVLEVALAFTIDRDAYYSDLRKHGVKITT